MDLQAHDQTPLRLHLSTHITIGQSPKLLPTSPKMSLANPLLLLLLLTVLTPLSSASLNRPPRFLVGNTVTHRRGLPYYDTLYFDQNLDHFSFNADRKFKQRYLLSTEYWFGPERNAPIFMYCGNEGDIVWFAENTGFVWDIAPLFGALVLFPEVYRFAIWF